MYDALRRRLCRRGVLSNSTTTTDVISFALMIVLYSVIIYKLKSQKVPGEPSNNAGEQRARRHRKVMKMTVAIGLAFALCWTPIDTYSFLSYFV